MRTPFLLLAVILLTTFVSSCEPKVEEGIDLPAPPSASFSYSFLPSDENTVIVQSESSGFLHFWDFGNGLTSNQATDTVTYPQAGTYEIVYSISNAGGMGTATQTVEIENSTMAPCEGTLALLTGCDDQKTWRFSQEAGAVSVGPDPYSSEWFSSAASSLQDEQYDDRYEFTVDGEYIYMNQGLTVYPFDGSFAPVELDVPELSYFMTVGTGTSGEEQIHLPNCWFMGIWNSGPVYDIIELDEQRLVIHAPLRDVDCVLEEGYFTLTFIAE